MAVSKPNRGASKVSKSSCRIAVDIGGTFTDVAFIGDEGIVATKKLLSTPHDYASAVVEGVLGLMRDIGRDPGELTDVLHGTTVATNAVLERRGARTALITTKGMRDVLELRRIRVPRLYDPLYVKPEPLVPRELRLEIAERLDARGNVVTPLDLNDVAAAIERIRKAQVESVAVTFLHSYVNDCHERKVGEILRRELPDCFVTLSVEILPEIREYERVSTTVINAYLGPPIKRYLESLIKRLDGIGFSGRLLIMQSSGGMIDAQTVIDKPAQIVECGPAAGVIGSQQVGRQIGNNNLITLDMGGTTAKASLIEEGKLFRTDEYEVGGGISLSSRLIKGGGYALKIPVIDISEVGAGGGSIVWLDRVGQMKVGPRSAGASPGPVCYSMGGSDPTVTDANVVLGYLNPKSLAGGALAVDSEAARRAIEEKIAKPLGRDVMDVAHGIYTIANITMMRAVKAISTYCGRNPPDFDMLAFGGNGSVHAADLAKALQMRRIIVPISAGVFSALGLLYSDIELELSKALIGTIGRIDPAQMDEAYRGLAQDMARHLRYDPEEIKLTRFANLRYVGQAYELTVPVPDRILTPDSVAALAQSFEAEHERMYGHRFPGKKDVQCITLRLRGTVALKGRRTIDTTAILGAHTSRGKEVTRPVYFGAQFGMRQTPVLPRIALGRTPTQGPLVIEEYEATAIVPPDATATLDQWANIIIELQPDATRKN
jgi:N-methylhydantoinase A